MLPEGPDIGAVWSPEDDAAAFTLPFSSLYLSFPSALLLSPVILLYCTFMCGWQGGMRLVPAPFPRPASFLSTFLTERLPIGEIHLAPAAAAVTAAHPGLFHFTRSHCQGITRLKLVLPHPGSMFFTLSDRHWVSRRLLVGVRIGRQFIFL